MNTDDSDQYVLVHHEYAGLAGFEENNGDDSNYSISNQVSGYLETQVVKKLAIDAFNPDRVCYKSGGVMSVPFNPAGSVNGSSGAVDEIQDTSLKILIGKLPNTGNFIARIVQTQVPSGNTVVTDIPLNQVQRGWFHFTEVYRGNGFDLEMKKLGINGNPGAWVDTAVSGVSENNERVNLFCAQFK